MKKIAILLLCLCSSIVTGFSLGYFVPSLIEKDEDTPNKNYTLTPHEKEPGMTLAYAIDYTAQMVVQIHAQQQEQKEANYVDMQPLHDEIEEILDDQKDDYGIVIKSLSRENAEITINEDEIFFPASVYKVPIAILILKDIQEGKYTLETTLELKEENKKFSSDYLYNKESGTHYTIETLLTYMIKYSDNTAWDILQDSLGSTEHVDNRFRDELHVVHTSKDPYQTSALDMSIIFEGLYSHTYVNEEYSEYLIDLLSTVVESHNDRIAAGVPDGTKVAHKIGNWAGVWQDAGIVYGEHGDYIIIVLNRNTTPTSARATISQISTAAWDFFNEVHQE